MNNSGLHPLGKTVLVKLEQVPEMDGGIAMPASVLERDQHAQVYATVVEWGALAWKDSPALPVGARVVIRKFAGEYVTGLDGKYRIVNEADIWATRDFDLPR